MIRQVPEQEIEQIAIEAFINAVPSVTKVSDQSVLRGILRGNARVAKRSLKDIMIAVSRLFPDLAYDSTLDSVADDRGVSARFSASQSSTFVRLIADAGTIYQQGVHTVSDNKGNVFDLEEDITIGSKGYDYVKVRSQQSGLSTNVDPYTVINVIPEPSGHVGVINEYGATGGRDVEDDDTFRQRIKEGPAILARGTLDYLAQAFMTFNSNVLRVIYEGVDTSGKVKLSILTVNGIDLTDDELNTILEQCGNYFSVTELAKIGTNSYGVLLKNVEYHYIDVDVRMELFSGASFESVVKDIQQKFAKYVDFRKWQSAIDRIEWDDLLGIIKANRNVKYVADKYFTPSTDITVLPYKFPRFRGFIARNLNGDIQINQSSTINPLYYPSDPNSSFTTSIL